MNKIDNVIQSKKLKKIDALDERSKQELKFADFFCGIGGFHVAASNLGMKCVFASDIDADCRKAYFENFNIITERPFSFESVDYIKLGYRRCACGSDSIYYRINNNIIEIMTIIGKQDLNTVL